MAERNDNNTYYNCSGFFEQRFEEVKTIHMLTLFSLMAGARKLKTYTEKMVECRRSIND